MARCLILCVCMLHVSSALRRKRNRETQEFHLIPYPAVVKSKDSEAFKIRPGAKLEVGAGISDEDLAVVTLRKLLGENGTDAKDGQTISMRLAEKKEGQDARAAEGYTLDIGEKKVDLAASDLAGLFYGVQTLRQLVQKDDQGETHLPAVTIEDKPRFEWRGLHLDVSRHFFEAEKVKKLINTMADFKLNRFHWHLTDDQGWRVPIEGYPKLTEVGSDGKGGRQAYTKEEIKDVVAYAGARNIMVIPEIDVPGHAQAALAAYPELGNTDADDWKAPERPWDEWGVSEYTLGPKNETWDFLAKVYDSLAELFPAKLVHIGGDEAMTSEWRSSENAKSYLRGRSSGTEEVSAVQAVFNTKTAELLKARGRGAVGWNEVLNVGGLPEDAIIMSWTSSSPVKQAISDGKRVVNNDQEKLYFDHYQGEPSKEPEAFGGYTPLEDVYDFDPMPKGIPEDQQKLFLGVQAQLWSEHMPDWKQVEYMAFPRSLALAERAWTPTSKIGSFDNFKKRLAVRLKDLDDAGVNYRKMQSD